MKLILVLFILELPNFDYRIFFSGRLGIVDNDVVELNNMHRQVCFLVLYCGCSLLGINAASIFNY